MVQNPGDKIKNFELWGRNNIFAKIQQVFKKSFNQKVMVSKKFKLLLMGIFSLFSFGVFAQDTGIYNIYDSSVISSKGQAQQNEFMNNTYDFPAKPRNQIELGVSGGLFSISGDVSSKLPTFGGAIHFRKALGYLFSLRLQYMYGVAKGLDWKASQGYAANGPLVAAGYNPATSPVYYNYKSTVQDLTLQGIFTLNNIRFHKQKTGMVIYAGIGGGFMAYKTMINAIGDQGNYSNLYNQVVNSPQGISNRKDIRDKLKEGMDDSYETRAQTAGNRRSTLGENTLRPTANVLAGIAFKLSNRVNLAIEDKFSFAKDDLMDGQQWQDNVQGVLTGDYDTYNYLSVGLNFNLGSKSVQPLWWLNPLDYAYSEINNPKHMKLPKPVFDDEDGDGVVDQLDKCAGTPAGVKVDSHGCPLDTDGDGVADYQDKELITPTYCQPVDADGVGKCPDPECCKNMVGDSSACNLGDLPSISYRGNSSALSSDGKAMLATVASKMKNSASCSIVVTGYPAASKSSQSLCNKRIDAIKAYLTEIEGISADRVSVTCEVGGGDANTVDIKAK
jgi:outer membrane protein OmpA-like peptidoglycan-associated protein